MNEYYTMDELRALGCPNGLLMQYIFCTKKEIDQLIGKSNETLRIQENSQTSRGWMSSMYERFILRKQKKQNGQ